MAADLAPPADLERGFGRRLLRNLTAQTASQAVTIVLSIVTTGVVARALDDVSFGGYQYIFMVLFFALAASDLGIPQTLVREIAREPSRTTELVQNVVGMRLVLAAATLIGAAIVLPLMQVPPGYRLAIEVALLILPIQAFATPIAVLQAHVRVGHGVVIETLNRVTSAGLTILAAWFGKGLLAMAGAIVAGETVGMLAVVWMTRGTVRPWPRFQFAVWIAHTRYSVPLSAGLLLSALLNRLDGMMLQSMAGLIPVGLYGAAYKIPNLCERLPQLVMATVFPTMSSLAERDVDAVRRIYRRTVFHLFVAAVPMVVGVWVAAPWAIPLWLGPNHEGVAALTRILIVASACLYVALPAGQLFVALRHPSLNLWATAPTMLLNLALNWIWIPKYGATGAAWANTVSYAALMVITLTAAEWLLARPRERREVTV